MKNLSERFFVDTWKYLQESMHPFKSSGLRSISSNDLDATASKASSGHGFNKKNKIKIMINYD